MKSLSGLWTSVPSCRGNAPCCRQCFQRPHTRTPYTTGIPFYKYGRPSAGTVCRTGKAHAVFPRFWHGTEDMISSRKQPLKRGRSSGKCHNRVLSRNFPFQRPRNGLGLHESRFRGAKGRSYRRAFHGARIHPSMGRSTSPYSGSDPASGTGQNH
ncbi:MAG: hypothetical protein BWY09_02480 [Candidatus Hydrogenedentes bacterium ADurb.Bin179]|nr:MAG: hypothetical protein BWY09_02480 [Candidatus Hydrogenedentes bacterium ADurb.Bin179]